MKLYFFMTASMITTNLLCDKWNTIFASFDINFTKLGSEKALEISWLASRISMHSRSFTW